MITLNTTLNLAHPKNYATVNECLNAGHCSQELIKTNFLNIESLEKLQQKITYKFDSKDLLIASLTHKSFYFENKQLVNSDNEKLEFVGDSIINFIITKKLFLNFTTLNEGELSKLRNSLVNEDSFSHLAKSINLFENIFIGRGELKSLGHLKSSILSDAFEALIGAIYLDSNNLATVEMVVEKIIENYELLSGECFFNLTHIDEFDSKTKLQELVMAKKHCAPVYLATELENGFEVELFVAGESLGKLQGASKKKLEKELAKIILAKQIF